MQVITDHQIIAPPTNADLMILTDGSIDDQARLTQIVTAVRAEGVWTVTAAGTDDFHTPYRSEAIDAMIYNAYLSLGPNTGGRGYSTTIPRGLRELP